MQAGRRRQPDLVGRVEDTFTLREEALGVVEGDCLGKGFRAEPAPAAEEVGQLPLSEAEAAREAWHVGFVRTVRAEIGDGRTDGLVVGFGGEGLVFAHDGGSIGRAAPRFDPILTLLR